ncbi:MAG: tRNA uridine-5-carboxymethylaminomethyl(34) synthesis GTPase MnmE [Clostridia bacterium]|nr:tRNA uridine-5-carboxymethylaminomethyl(34) synthesis GTPase MnmE [Clostridia bacterium]
MFFSTIAAVSTPVGKGGVAVIRISGSEAVQISSKIFKARNGKRIEEHLPRFQIYGDILSFEDHEVIDDGLLSYFVSPSSFTGEDVVEISCHGGEIVTGMVLSSVLSAGAVLAQPGEFSRRAFVNGKLSLTAAEGIADLLDAKTEEAALLSSKASRGKLTAAINEISDSILTASSSLWAYLDYPEEDLQSLTDEDLCLLLDQSALACEKLIRSFSAGRAVNSGISTVIVGKPNVGKSTFFNLLLGEEKAIVTDIPGTTRDVIEYPVKAGKVLLNLSDTAGVRSDAGDAVEEIGIQKALTVLQEAELIFALFDLSRPFEDDDERIVSYLENLPETVKIIPIFTKSDLPTQLSFKRLEKFGEGYTFCFSDPTSLQNLFGEIEHYYISDEAAFRDGRILTNARQKAQIEKARNLLLLAKDQILESAKDLASLTLEEALSAILETDGKSAGDMILDQVFSRFCVGK